MMYPQNGERYFAHRPMTGRHLLMLLNWTLLSVFLLSIGLASGHDGSPISSPISSADVLHNEPTARFFSMLHSIYQDFIDHVLDTSMKRGLDRIGGDISPHCVADLKKFMRAIRSQTPWAMKSML